MTMCQGCYMHAIINFLQVACLWQVSLTGLLQDGYCIGADLYFRITGL